MMKMAEDSAQINFVTVTGLAEYAHFPSLFITKKKNFLKKLLLHTKVQTHSRFFVFLQIFFTIQKIQTQDFFSKAAAKEQYMHIEWKH